MYDHSSNGWLMVGSTTAGMLILYSLLILHLPWENVMTQALGGGGGGAKQVSKEKENGK